MAGGFCSNRGLRKATDATESVEGTSSDANILPTAVRVSRKAAAGMRHRCFTLWSCRKSSPGAPSTPKNLQHAGINQQALTIELHLVVDFLNELTSAAILQIPDGIDKVTLAPIRLT